MSDTPIATPKGTLLSASRKTRWWLARLVGGVPELAPRFTKHYCILDDCASIRPNAKQILVRLPLPQTYSRKLEPAGVGKSSQRSPNEWHHRWKSLFRVARTTDIPQAITFIRVAAKLAAYVPENDDQHRNHQIENSLVTMDRELLVELRVACRMLMNVLDRIAQS